jgi:hypothetical protein
MWSPRVPGGWECGALRCWRRCAAGWLAGCRLHRLTWGREAVADVRYRLKTHDGGLQTGPHAPGGGFRETSGEQHPHGPG